MFERRSYKGMLNGVFGIFTDTKPEGLDLQEEVVFYVPDEDKIFVDKDGNMIDCVIITDGVDIKEFTEIVKPKEEGE